MRLALIVLATLGAGRQAARARVSKLGAAPRARPLPPRRPAPPRAPARVAARAARGDEQTSPRSAARAALDGLNASTKWAVVASQLAALVCYRSVGAPLIVVGMVLASALGARLKRALDQPRPAAAAGAPAEARLEPGMPSSHALVTAFAAAAWACELRADSRLALALGGGALCVGWLRVATGYHTRAQVAVGLGLGGVLGGAWMAGARAVGVGSLPPGSRAARGVSLALYAACAAALARFAARNARAFGRRR
jgi:hypothetical protein